jgi:hypothetical protein
MNDLQFAGRYQCLPVKIFRPSNKTAKLTVLRIVPLVLCVYIFEAAIIVLHLTFHKLFLTHVIVFCLKSYIKLHIISSCLRCISCFFLGGSLSGKENGVCEDNISVKVRLN